MKEKKKRSRPLEGEAVMQTKPTELAEALAEAKKRIADVRREIEDGARPKKGRFRL